MKIEAADCRTGRSHQVTHNLMRIGMIVFCLFLIMVVLALLLLIGKEARL